MTDSAPDAVPQRYIVSHVHQGRIGVLVEFDIETRALKADPGFTAFALDVAVHVAAMNPADVAALLAQRFVKDAALTVAAALADASTRYTERISVTRLLRWGPVEALAPPGVPGVAPARSTEGGIRACTPDDAAALCAIYNYYVTETVVTFEETPVAVDDMAERIRSVTVRLPWLVWEQDGSVLGYAYATPWKGRSAYRHSVESTVYLAPHATRQGLGTHLYTALIDALKAAGVHCVVGGAALPNPGSVALHENLGFTQVARLREIGYKHGRWVDVGYWQRIL